MTATLNLNTIRQRATKFAKNFEGVTSEKERDQDFMRGFCTLFGINPSRIDWQYKVKLTIRPFRRPVHQIAPQWFDKGWAGSQATLKYAAVRH